MYQLGRCVRCKEIATSSTTLNGNRHKIYKAHVISGDTCISSAHLVLVKRLLPQLLVEVQQALVGIENILESNSLLQVATPQLRSKATQKLRVPFGYGHGVLVYRSVDVPFLRMVCFGLADLRAASICRARRTSV